MAAKTLDELLQAMKTWEEAELQPTYPNLVSYASFPSQDEIDGGLEIPYIMHVWRGATPKVMTIGNPLEVMIVWVIETYFVAGDQINDMASLQITASQHAIDYLTGWLKHRSLGGLLTVKENQLIDCGFGAWDLFGMNVIGHKWQSDLTTRQTMETGN